MWTYVHALQVWLDAALYLNTCNDNKVESNKKLSIKQDIILTNASKITDD